MEPEGSRKEKLLEGLVDEALFRGAALVSDDGRVQSSRGASDALEATTDRNSRANSDESEDVYVVSLGDGYLVVTFASHVEFEPVEALVDDWLERLELD